MGVLVRLVVLVSFLIFVGWIAGGLYLDRLIKTGVETIGPKITGTTVSLDHVNWSVLTGRCRLKGLVVGNPKGFYTESAYDLGDTTVTIDLNSLLSGQVIIEEILIDPAEITHEVNLSGNNLDKIQEHVEAFGRSYGLTGNAKSGSDNTGVAAPKVQINHFIIKNLQLNVSASLFRGRSLTFELDDVYLRDIGKESGGVTVDRATSKVMARTKRRIAHTVPESNKALEKRLKREGRAVKRPRDSEDRRVSTLLKDVGTFFRKIGDGIESLVERLSAFRKDG